MVAAEGEGPREPPAGTGRGRREVLGVSREGGSGLCAGNWSEMSLSPSRCLCSPYIYIYIKIYALTHTYMLHLIKFPEKPPAGLIETGNFVASCKVLP